MWNVTEGWAIVNMPSSLVSPGRWIHGLVFAAISVLIFSGWFVVTRFTVTHQLRIWDVTALRFGVGAVLLSPVLFKQRLPAAAWLEGLLYAVLWGAPRSEEHTSELQSLMRISYAVFCLK